MTTAPNVRRPRAAPDSADPAARGGGAAAEPADRDAGTRANAGAPAVDAADVLRQFRVIFRSVKKHFQVIERECGIGGSQLWALATIAQSPGIRVTDLARTLSIHQSTASNLVENLVRLGLVERMRDEADQRVVRLGATGRGNALVSKAPRPLIGVLPDALSRLEERELERLHSALVGLLGVMRVRDERAMHTPLADM